MLSLKKKSKHIPFSNLARLPHLRGWQVWTESQSNPTWWSPTHQWMGGISLHPPPQPGWTESLSFFARCSSSSGTVSFENFRSFSQLPLT